MKTSKYWLAAAVGVALIGAAGAAPYSRGQVSATDVGAASALAENSDVTVTVALKLRNPDQLEQAIAAVYTKGSPQYRQFITPEQFKAQYGPSPATIAAVTQKFASQGLKVTQSSTAQLHVSGTAAQIEKAFSVQLHAFEVAATASTPSYRFRAPLSAAQVPAEIAGSVRAVLGLSTKPRLTPHLRRNVLTPKGRGSSAPNTPDPPGNWTVVDFAQYYDVDPLYKQGITGQGRTVGIITLASFTQSDAYTYWSAIGLSVSQHRITEVQIDGGAGPISDAGGSDETTLDVEQSGGVAPGAKIVVYEAPNTDQGFIDAFALAIDSNRADTVSTSWGQWEAFDGSNPVVSDGPVTNPTNGQQSNSIVALDDLLAQAALQGQSFFASSGDYGAYDSSNSLPIVPSDSDPDSFNPVLSVDDPAMQRYITAAGGTTLPGPELYNGPNGTTVTINIQNEQAWSWSYLVDLCNSLGFDPVSCGIYPIGSGGGVSIYVQRPFYQWFVPGMVSTVAKQTLFQLTPAPEQKLYHLPAGFPGRNVPDLSFNGDPDTGYVLYYTSSENGFGLTYFYGGTSFVAPQLNGMTNLFVSALHHRIGLLNPALYYIAATGGYHGKNAPFRQITQGNNWFWQGHAGYDQATGIGVPDVANLLQALKQID